MTLEEQFEIIKEYIAGTPIQYRMVGATNWVNLTPACKYVYGNHEFDFERNEYRIKPDKWRAEKNKTYYYIDSYLDITWTTEKDDEIDAKRFEAGNYFEKVSDAQGLRDQMCSLLHQFHNNRN